MLAGATPMIGIVTVNWNGFEMTSTLLNQILENDIQEFRMVVVNNSPDEIEEFQHISAFQDPRIKFIDSPTNVGYSGGLNLGIKQLLSIPEISHFLLMNNDLHIETNFISQLLGQAEENQKIYSPLILYQDTELVQNTGGNLLIWLGGAVNINKNVPVSKIRKIKPGYLSGCVLFLSRSVIERVGLFDENFGSYGEDVDYSIRAQSLNIGLEILWGIQARHFHSYSTRGNLGYKVYLLNRNQILLAKKHLPPLKKEIFIMASILRGAIQSIFHKQFRSYFKGMLEGLLS